MDYIVELYLLVRYMCWVHWVIAMGGIVITKVESACLSC